MPGPWEKYGGGDPVIAGPDPYKQQDAAIAAENLRLKQKDSEQQSQLFELTLADKQRQNEQDQEKAAKLDNAKSTATSQLRGVIDKIDRVALDATDNAAFPGLGETGMSGAVASTVPGTAGYDLRSNLQTINANSAFSALQAMRDASPTGGALGQVTERELALLQSTIANLDASQSQSQFLANLTDAKKAYLDMLDRLEPGASQEYNNKPGIRFDENGARVVHTVGEDKREARDPQGGPVVRPRPDGGGGGGFMEGLARGAGDVVEGAGDIVGIAANPIGQVLYNALGYDQQYDLGRSLREASGLPDNPDPVSSAINKGGIAALTGSGIARGVAGLASPGVTQNVLAAIGRTPGRDAVAGMGAGLGGEVGRSSGIPGGELAGNVIGGFAGYGGANTAMTGVNALRGTNTPNTLSQASQRLNVDLLPADAGGDVAKMVTSGTKVSPLSATPVRNQARETHGQMRSAAGNIAASQGDAAATTDKVGASVKKGAERYLERSTQRGEALYTRAKNAAGGVKSIKPAQTVQAIDTQIARLRENPTDQAASTIEELTKFRDNIANGVSIQGLRDARTELSAGVYNGQLRSSPQQGMWKNILGNIGNDVDAGLRSVGKDKAADLYKQADAFWKGRIETIDEALKPILTGNKGGEEIVAQIESMSRGKQGGVARLSRVLAELSPKEAGDVRAAIINRLGKARDGAQNAEGDVFSPSTFLTNWNSFTPQAKSSMFANKELRKDLDALAQLSEATKASQGFENFSNTSLSGFSNAGVGVAAAAINPAIALLGASTQVVTGRLMASPRFARLLLNVGKMPPERAGRLLPERLGRLAGAEPILANDISQVQAFLREGLSSSPGRAAAQDKSDSRSVPPAN